MMELPPELQRILQETPALRRAYLVGGCVRDALWDIPHKDYDIEVFEISYQELASALARWGRTDLVGRSFGVVKLTTLSGHTYDFTVPRRDSKVAPGHKGFAIEFDPAISPRDAAARRDFTINALMYDPHTRQVLDFFGGLQDVQQRILRHTTEAFGEDPLRVLRGMQFASRFSLTPAPETIALCRAIKHGYSELALERVREEWFKWAEKSVTPSAGLKFLAATGWIDHYPELKAMAGVPQDPEWHPEGDVFVHTCHCCDAMAQLPDWRSADSESRIVYMLAVLCHDLGKPLTTHQAERAGRMRTVSPGHEAAGVPVAESFLKRIDAPLAVRERILPLVANHMVSNDQLSDRTVRRLAKRLEPETIQGLCVVMSADSLGRPPRPPVIPTRVSALLARAQELQVHASAPSPLLLGRHLLELGMQPGKPVGEILHHAYDAQLEGSFFTLPEALDWLTKQTILDLPLSVRDALARRNKK